jgi:DNA-directed RNA polymerase specialized sigma subunit
MNKTKLSAKDYLSQAWEIKIRLEAMAEQLEFLKAAAVYVSPQFSDRPKTASRNIHETEDAVIRILEFQERMDKQYVKLNEINEMINSVSRPAAQAILVKRYLGGNTWNEISKSLHISRSRIFELHSAALAEIEKSVLNRTVSDE